SADPYVQYPLWSQSLNRYSYGFNNPMSGTDPTGYGWLDSISVGDAVGAMVIAGHAVSYAILLSSGDSTSGAAPTSGGITTGSLAGSALGIGHAAHGLANAPSGSNPVPTRELGSGGTQGGADNENAGAAPPGAQGATACYPGCLPNPRSGFPDTPLGDAQYQAWLDATWVVGNVILAAELPIALGRWLVTRALLRELALQGIKHTPANIVRIERIGERIVFLETGTAKAGLLHIVKEHGAQFARRGISEGQIPDALFTALR